MKPLAIFPVLALALCMGTIAHAVPPGYILSTNELKALGLGASNSLATFQHHITPANYQSMGFSAPGEILLATNGEPLLSFTVPFNQLTNYQAIKPLKALLEPQRQTELRFRVFVPIMVGTNVRSSSILRPEQTPANTAPTRWVRVDWGHPTVIRNLMATYAAAPGAEIKNQSVPFAVEIPILRIWFIGYLNQQNELVLLATTTLHLGPFTINPHEALTKAAMQELANQARRHKPNLPN